MTFKNRQGAFNAPPDETMRNDIESDLKAARVAILEYRLGEAVQQSKTNVSKAINMVNTQISPRALELANIKPLQDVHKTLWAACANILEGKALAS